MLRWSDRAFIALRKLFEPLQDIDVYVEDTNDEAFYRSLLNYASREEVRIARVFALGGRQKVIDSAINHNQKIRRALFIIDGDLSWVKGEPVPNITGLHQHEAYCIENLILCENALSHILSQEVAITEDKATILLSYKQWVHTIERPLVELFSAFATLHNIDPSIPTIANGVGILCSADDVKGTTELDLVKVNKAKMNALKSAEKLVASTVITESYINMLKRLNSLVYPLNAVSGKDYLLPLINFHLHSLGCKVKRKSLRIRLACAGDLNRFAHLTTALINASRGY